MVEGEEGSDGWRFGLGDGGRRGFVWRQVGIMEGEGDWFFLVWLPQVGGGGGGGEVVRVDTVVCFERKRIQGRVRIVERGGD